MVELPHRVVFLWLAVQFIGRQCSWGWVRVGEGALQAEDPQTVAKKCQDQRGAGNIYPVLLHTHQALQDELACLTSGCYKAILIGGVLQARANLKHGFYTDFGLSSSTINTLWTDCFFKGGSILSIKFNVSCEGKVGNYLTCSLKGQRHDFRIG
jgi:hypothetical protein